MASDLATNTTSHLPERSALAAALLAALVLYYATVTLLAWRRLWHFPGPPLAGVTNLWAFAAVASGRCHAVLALAQAAHGPGAAVRIGPAALMVCDAATLWRINGARRGAYARGGWYASMRFHPDGDSVLSETRTATHDARKARLAAGFAGRGAMSLEADVDAQVAALVKYLRGKVLESKHHQATGGGGGGAGGCAFLDFSRVIRWFQLDLITLVGLGKAWGDLADETDHFDFLGSMNWVVPFAHSISMVPWMRTIVFSKLFLYLAAPRVTDKKGLGRSYREMRAAVEARFEDNNEATQGRQHGDMLGEWIQHHHSAKQCELDLAILMPAGTETTVTALRGTLLHLLTSPAAYHKLKREIADGIHAGRISQPVTDAQTREMPFLLAVISEGMRMCPPVINGLAKKVPPGGDIICGKFVPEGTEIHVNCESMVKNPDVFGADAQIFRPERFLEGDATQRAHMLKTVDLLFGHGRWLCLGKHFAKMEMSKVMVELFRVFDFQITNPERPWIRKTFSTAVIDDFGLRLWENPLDVGE